MTSYIYNNHLSNTGPWRDQIEEKLEVFFFFFLHLNKNIGDL